VLTKNLKPSQRSGTSERCLSRHRLLGAGRSFCSFRLLSQPPGGNVVMATDNPQ
jgi:hypothetical protein